MDFEYVKVVFQLSNVVKQIKVNDDTESMVIAGEKGGNIISYVDFSKKFHVIKCFPDLKQTFGKEDINFTLS